MLQSFIDHGLRGEALRQEVSLQLYVHSPSIPLTLPHLTIHHFPPPKSFAGSDTVASVLSTALLCLLTHPPCYTRLQSELDAAFPIQSKLCPATATIRDSQARRLPYLQAVMREALRFVPPLTTPPVFKEVPASGDTVCGYRLPGGTLVATGNVIWHGCRERAFWGEDAEWFRPERWLEEGDAERLVQMNRRVDLVFGSGQFVCVGRGVAMVELNKVLAEVSRVLYM
jgi:cytochrome P450